MGPFREFKEFPPDGEKIVAVTTFDGDMYVATDSGLYVMVDGKLESVKMVVMGEKDDDPPRT